MATLIQLKRGYKEQWEKYNILLAVGEPGFEVDTGKLKIGDGKTKWNDLPYTNEDVVNANTHFDFPNVGKVHCIYKAEKEKKIYQWNSVELKYEVLSETESNPFDIDKIDGGNANGIIGKDS